MEGSKINFKFLFLFAIIFLALSVNSVSAQDASFNETLMNDDFDSIQILIDNAESGDSIFLENKTYVGNGNPIVIDKDVSILGSDFNNVVLDACNESSIFIVSQNIKVNLYGLTLTNGYNLTEGGAIYNLGTLTIDNSKISNNYAESGAIRSNDKSTLTITNSLFDGNRGSFGAAIDNYVGNLKIINTTFVNNDCLEGGAIYNRFGDFLVYNCTFRNNSAARGGGVYNNRGYMEIRNSKFIANNVYDLGGGIKSWGACEVYDTIVENNTAECGGGIYCSEFYLVTKNCLITNNNAHWGGGIYIEARAKATVENSTIFHNSADRGGGIDLNQGALNLINSNVDNNVAKTNGGGIYCCYLPTNIKNSSISNNVANNGGGVYLNGFKDVLVKIEDSIIYNNSANENGGAIYNSGSFDLNKVEVISNNAKNDGGAIYNIKNFNLDDVNLMLNEAVGNGGAIYNDKNLTAKNSQMGENKVQINGGTIYNNGFVDLDNIVFLLNAGKFGGVIYNSNLIKINNSIFKENNAFQGGSIYSTANLTICNSQFIRNLVSHNAGVLMLPKGNVLIKNSVFKQNINADEGGCIFNNNANVVVEDSQFLDNSAKSYGAAIDNSGNLTVKNSIFDNNDAYGAGAIDNGGELTVVNSNFVNNHATGMNGGAIDNKGNMVVVGSIFENNIAEAKGGAVMVRDNTSISYSSIFNNKDANGYSIFNSGVENLRIINNWWGDNNPNFEKLLNYNVSNENFTWIIMNVSSEATLTQLKTANIIISFANVRDVNNKISKISSLELLPKFKVNLSSGQSIVVVDGFALNSIYVPLISEISFKIDNQKVNLKITPTNKKIIDNKDVVVDYNGKTTFKVRVINNGKPVGENVAIVMKISNEKYIVKTDKNGWASKHVSLLPGKYKIAFYYKGFTAKNTITVKKVLFAKSTIMKKAKKIRYSAYLKNSKGNPIVGKKITFKINGKTYSAKTNRKGQATVYFKNLKVGKYSVVVKYLNSSVRVKLMLKK